MKYLKYLVVGVFFGILMSKSEVVSWYRIYEMFRFDSFHMYGVIGSAIVIGIIFIQLIKRTHMKSLVGTEISFTPKNRGIARYLIGGIIFGLGWALTGACPGPMFVLVGHGVGVMLVVIASATVGTFTYGVLRDKLPH
jgi:hypothetical protein